MLVRFECPACRGSHIFDMPETTIHMTCSQTHEVIQLRLTKGGDVRTEVLGNGEVVAPDKSDQKNK